MILYGCDTAIRAEPGRFLTITRQVFEQADNILIISYGRRRISEKNGCKASETRDKGRSGPGAMWGAENVSRTYAWKLIAGDLRGVVAACIAHVTRQVRCVVSVSIYKPETHGNNHLCK